MTAQKVIDIANAEVGYIEKQTNDNLDDKTANAGSNNYTKYGRDTAEWGLYNGSKNGYPWCDQFVDWCFVKALGDKNLLQGLIYQPLGGEGAGCEYSAKYYKDNSALFTSPQVGDQIFFKNLTGEIIHTGLVCAVDSSKVYTVEGNTSSAAGVVANGGCVAKKSYSLAYNLIYGYGRPKYSNKSEDDLMSKEYDELKQKIDALNKVALPIYDYVDDNMPEWMRPTIKKLQDHKIINGDENGGLQLDYNTGRLLVILDRAGAFNNIK